MKTRLYEDLGAEPTRLAGYEGNTGILISGHIDSMPVKDEDWSGKDIIYKL